MGNYLFEKRPYEIVADVVARIAFPAPNDVEDREAYASHLRAGFARWLEARVGEAAKDEVRLADFLPDSKETAKRLRRLEPLLRKRLLAGHMAIFFLTGAAQEPIASYLPRYGKLTIENIASGVASRNGTDERNMRRIFSDASPVLNLVAAWALLAKTPDPLGNLKFDIFELMANAETANLLFQKAAEMERLIDRSPSLAKAQREMTRFSIRQG